MAIVNFSSWIDGHENVVINATRVIVEGRAVNDGPRALEIGRGHLPRTRPEEEFAGHRRQSFHERRRAQAGCRLDFLRIEVPHEIEVGRHHERLYTYLRLDVQVV